MQPHPASMPGFLFNERMRDLFYKTKVFREIALFDRNLELLIGTELQMMQA
jgi:hypothetical protein